MSIFNLFNKKTEVAPGFALSKRLTPYWPQIESTRLPYIKIEAKPADNLSFAQSKFGGPPVLPKDFAYPTDTDGKPMFPLAQLNFAEMPTLEGFPAKGWLQFYISTNDNFGIDFHHRTSQKNFRVLYFEDIDENNIQTNFDFITKRDMYDYSPVSVQHALSFSLQEEYVGAHDIRFKKALGMSATKLAQTFRASAAIVLAELYQQLSANGHKIGGYAYFGDRDPRVDKKYTDQIPDFGEYILLLQIASVPPPTEDAAPDIMWANYGVGNFFIHPEHLRKRDFSSVAYNWDSQKEAHIRDPYGEDD
jgi:uncharacterized protein YwqG